MSEPELLVAEDGPLLEVTLNRPSKYNAINPGMLDQLWSAFRRFEAHRALRVLLIRGAGKYFSSGFDVTTLSPDMAEEGPAAFRARYREAGGHTLYDSFEAIGKPIVVAHHGPCLGGALEMSLSCDFRLAAATAEYALPELDMGMIPGSGGTSRLVRIVGTHWARWLIMAAQRISAEQAHTIGLVHQVWPIAEFEQKTRDFCMKLAEQPPEALAAAKLAIEFAADLDRAQARNLERLVNSSLAGGVEQERVFAALRARFTKPSGSSSQ